MTTYQNLSLVFMQGWYNNENTSVPSTTTAFFSSSSLFVFLIHTLFSFKVGFFDGQGCGIELLWNKY